MMLKKYYTTIRELLAIVFAFDKFKASLLGISIVAFTYHSTSTYLPRKKDAKDRLIRWISLLQEFINGNFINHKKMQSKENGSSWFDLALVNYFTLSVSKPRSKTTILPKKKKKKQVLIQ